MKVGPEPHASVASASRPETQESRFRVEKVDEIGQHGIAIGGMFISNNCNTILLVMSLLFIIGGVIFTAISYRPQVSDEDMQQYRDRQMSEDVSQGKIVGPICMIIGMVMLSFSIMFSTIFCILQKSHQELSTNWAMRRTISVIDPNAPLNISRALTGAPQAVIEITTSYKIKSYRTRSVDNISLATKPQNAISETQRRSSLSPNHWIHENELHQRSYHSRISILSTNMEQPVISDPDCVDYSDNPNIYEFIAEDMDDPGFDDTYFQSTNSDNQHLFAQSQDKTMKRDIACFPTSTPMSMSPAIMHRSESDKTRPESAEDLKQYGSSKNQKLPPLNPVGIVKVTTESDESFYKLPDIRKDSFPE